MGMSPLYLTAPSAINDPGVEAAAIATLPKEGEAVEQGTVEEALEEDPDPDDPEENGGKNLSEGDGEQVPTNPLGPPGLPSPAPPADEDIMGGSSPTWCCRYWG